MIKSHCLQTAVSLYSKISIAYTTKCKIGKSGDYRHPASSKRFLKLLYVQKKVNGERNGTAILWANHINMYTTP